MKKHPLSPAEVSRGMTASIWDVILAGPFYNLIQTSGAIFTGFFLVLGANNFQIGIFAAVGPLLSGLSLVSARLMEQGGDRKRHYLTTAAVQRGLFFTLLGFPFLASRMPDGGLVWLLLALVVTATVFHLFQLTAWVSWMADMIPLSQRGSFFSRRNLIGGCTWLALAWGTGRYLESRNTLWNYALVFSAFAFASLVALKFAARQPDPALVVAARHPSFRSLLSMAFANRPIKIFLFFQLAWGFTTNLAAPFYMVYMQKNLQMGMARVNTLAVLAGLTATLTAPWWGRMLDRSGERATLLFSLIGTCVLGCLWPLVNASNLAWLLPFILIAGGFFQGGVQMGIFNTFLGVLPEKNKTSYVALLQTVVGTLVGLSPILGGWLANGGLGALSLPLDSVMLVIVVSAALKFIPLVLVSSMPNRHGHSITYMVQEYVLVNPFKVVASITQDLFGAEREKK